MQLENNMGSIVQKVVSLFICACLGPLCNDPAYSLDWSEDDISNSTHCQCIEEFDGPLSEQRVTQNNASCVQYSHCEIKLPDCASNLCQNNATCQDQDHSCECYFNCTNAVYNGTISYLCDCSAGFSTICELKINWCSSNCTSTTDTFLCSCGMGYTGTFCEIKLPDCASNLCQNGATCQDLDYGYKCHCADGYSGDDCETDIDECAVEPCENGGNCTNAVNDFICNCTGTDYHGNTCSDIDHENTTINPHLNNTSTNIPGSDQAIKPALIVGIVGGAVVIIIIILGIFLIKIKKRRSARGTYNPRLHEMSRGRVVMDDILKLPPQERLI
ncbi:fibropellin-1-like isoform X2 [Acanthaster planci]|uniref:Fibropellin-1-like isoform X2 n=1 Tax=Acanthaster planci TaxID=133434 RepID=A0A8B7XWS2_ACAPL|nr:fibropellin-1-like isoform X2 [Acanthaster planci]